MAEVLGDALWGRVEERTKDGETQHVWVCACDSLSLNPPGEDMISYRWGLGMNGRDYLKEQFPKKNVQEEPDAGKRKEYNDSQRHKISEKLALFIKPGNPGAKFKKVYDKMLANLELPKHVKEQLGLSPVAGVDKPAEEKKVATISRAHGRLRSRPRKEAMLLLLTAKTTNSQSKASTRRR